MGLTKMTQTNVHKGFWTRQALYRTVLQPLFSTLTFFTFTKVWMRSMFCPPTGGMLHNHEFSTDFIEQFIEHSGIVLPEDVAATMGDDSKEAFEKRGDYIYAELREEWVEFNAWRWEKFFKKLCDRVHAIGKEVMALAMYCTDPFETLYCIGLDLNRIVNAGVDYVTANILPTSGGFANPDEYPYYFHRYMAIASTTAAHLPKGHLISMLGLQDATEEWNVMNHAPCEHERDIYTMMSYQLVDGDGTSRALDGFFLCLGDGIKRSDWDWERERLEIGMTAKPNRVISPAMYWSDYAYKGMLHEYIYTRRWTPFKLFYELAKSGANCAATVRPEGLKNYSGTLVVPNVDMLSPEEQKDIASYNRGSVFCTASPDFDPVSLGITPVMLINDRFSRYPMKAFVFGCEVSDDVRSKVEVLLAQDDGTPNLEGSLKDVAEPSYTLMDTLTFSKVTQGFIDAMALLLNDIIDSPFDINKPNIVLQMPDGAYRLYIFNDCDHKYHRAFVKAKNGIIDDVKNISKFPILPPRFMEESTNQFMHLYTGEEMVKTGFETKMQPAGVTILDVYLRQ